MKKLPIFSVIINLNLTAQETEEIPIDELRNNEINDLLEIVKKNRSIYVNEDNRRLQLFLDKIEERTRPVSYTHLTLPTKA